MRSKKRKRRIVGWFRSSFRCGPKGERGEKGARQDSLLKLGRRPVEIEQSERFMACRKKLEMRGSDARNWRPKKGEKKKGGTLFLFGRNGWGGLCPPRDGASKDDGRGKGTGFL